MCTVSWLPDRFGYSLCFNRDERLTRAPALPPAVRESAGVSFIAPRDGNFGGTWIAANTFGLSLGVVNQYRAREYTPLPSPRSRGALIPELIMHTSPAGAITALAGLDLTVMPPFTLFAAAPGTPVHLAAWDGLGLSLSSHAEPGLLLTSSSVSEPAVTDGRRALFAAAGAATVEALRALHRSHLPERGARSVCMHRDDAETQSYSEVRVTPDAVRFSHVDVAPCRGVLRPAILLARRAVPCPTLH